MTSLSTKRGIEDSPGGSTITTKRVKSNSSIDASKPTTAREQVMWLKDPAPPRPIAKSPGLNQVAMKLFADVKAYSLL